MVQTNKRRHFIKYIELESYLRHGIRDMTTSTVYMFKLSPWLAQNIKDITKQISEQIPSLTNISTNY